MGTVFRAHHVHLRRDVAVKRLTASGGGEQALRRFYQEMAAIGAVECEHVVRAMDAGPVEGRHLLVMEYIEGLDLQKVVRAVGPLKVCDACEIVRQATVGLSAIERCGLVHRDIKPSNLMLSVSGRLKILDLGLARLRLAGAEESELTRSDQVIGTADYIAPEQIAAQGAVDSRADLYGLGCTLYKLLSGHAPFSGDCFDTVPRKLEAHRHEAPPPIEKFRSDLPADLRQLLMELLAKDPAARPPTADEVQRRIAGYATGADLQALVAQAQRALPAQADRQAHGSGVFDTDADFAASETQASSPRRSGRFRRKKLAWAGAAVLTAVVLAVGAFLLFFHGSGKRVGPPDFDGAPPLQWNSLLGEPPTEQLWPLGEGYSSWHLDPKLGQLSVQCADGGLLELGTCTRDNYKIQLSFHQNQPEGGIGVFLGMRPIVYRGQPAQRYQYLEIRKITDFQKAIHYRMYRGIITIYLDPAGRRLYDSSEYAESEIPPLQPEQLLEFEIEQSRLLWVRLNGTPLVNLTLPDRNAEFHAEDHHGGFGIAVSRSSSIIRDAKIMILEPDR
jgi:serine/threonine protein kinase